MKQLRLKNRIIGFIIALIITGGFTLLGIMLDIKIITKYDVNPYGSFTLYLLCVGILVGGVVGIRTMRKLKGTKTKYPMASPDLEGDVYFPRSNIPRPIHKDFREYPEYFKKRKKKTRDTRRRE